MRKDSKLFLKKLLDYRQEIKKIVFKLILNIFQIYLI